MREEATRRQRGLQRHARAVETQGAQLRLELNQLHHEVGVGRDDVATGADVLEGIIQLQGAGVHEVG